MKRSHLKAQLFVVILVVLFTLMARAEVSDFSGMKCLSVRETAEELLNMEASGRQVGDSTCITESNFPRYKIGPRGQAGGEHGDTRAPVVLSGKQPYEIKSVVKNESSGSYTVKFDYVLSGGKRVSDSFEFIPYVSGPLKKTFGCGAILSAPKTAAVHAACLPSSPSKK